MSRTTTTTATTIALAPLLIAALTGCSSNSTRVSTPMTCATVRLAETSSDESELSVGPVMLGAGDTWGNALHARDLFLDLEETALTFADSDFPAP